mmetsp:Transcript_32402/g.93661  ORF Transcript_32402/g.93661 Transcript_32402/m.93661 type:complete len:254 (-) Transcript_32402:189-950(-)
MSVRLLVGCCSCCIGLGRPSVGAVNRMARSLYDCPDLVENPLHVAPSRPAQPLLLTIQELHHPLATWYFLEFGDELFDVLRSRSGPSRHLTAGRSIAVEFLQELAKLLVGTHQLEDVRWERLCRIVNHVGPRLHLHLHPIVSTNANTNTRTAIHLTVPLPLSPRLHAILNHLTRPQIGRLAPLPTLLLLPLPHQLPAVGFDGGRCHTIWVEVLAVERLARQGGTGLAAERLEDGVAIVGVAVFGDDGAGGEAV